MDERQFPFHTDMEEATYDVAIEEYLQWARKYPPIDGTASSYAKPARTCRSRSPKQSVTTRDNPDTGSKTPSMPQLFSNDGTYDERYNKRAPRSASLHVMHDRLSSSPSLLADSPTVSAILKGRKSYWEALGDFKACNKMLCMENEQLKNWKALLTVQRHSLGRRHRDELRHLQTAQAAVLCSLRSRVLELERENVQFREYATGRRSDLRTDYAESFRKECEKLRKEKFQLTCRLRPQEKTLRELELQTQTQLLTIERLRFQNDELVKQARDAAGRSKQSQDKSLTVQKQASIKGEQYDQNMRKLEEEKLLLERDKTLQIGKQQRLVKELQKQLDSAQEELKAGSVRIAATEKSRKAVEDSLQEKSKSYQAELQRRQAVEEQLSSAQKEVEKAGQRHLETEKQNLEKVREIEAETQATRLQYSRLTEEMAQAKAEHLAETRRLESDVKQLTDRESEAKKAVVEAEEKLMVKREQMDNKLQDELQAERKKQESFKEKLTEVSTSMAEKEQEIQTLMDNLKSQEEQLTAKIAESKQQDAAALKQVQEASQELQKKFDSVLTQKEALESEVQHAQKKIDSLELAAVESKETAQKQEAARAAEAVEAKETAEQQEKAKAAGNDAVVTKLEAAVSQSAQELTDTKTKITELEAQIQNLQKEKDDLQTTIQSLEQAAIGPDSASNLLDQATKKLQQVEEERGSLTTKLQTSERLLKESNSRIEEVQQQLEVAEKQAESESLLTSTQEADLGEEDTSIPVAELYQKLKTKFAKSKTMYMELTQKYNDLVRKHQEQKKQQPTPVAPAKATPGSSLFGGAPDIFGGVTSVFTGAGTSDKRKDTAMVGTFERAVTDEELRGKYNELLDEYNKVLSSAQAVAQTPSEKSSSKKVALDVINPMNLFKPTEAVKPLDIGDAAPGDTVEQCQEQLSALRKNYENLEHENSAQKCRIQELEASQSQTPKSSGLTTVFGMFGGAKDQKSATEPPKAEQFVSGVPESELRGKYNELLEEYNKVLSSAQAVAQTPSEKSSSTKVSLDVINPMNLFKPTEAVKPLDIGDAAPGDTVEQCQEQLSALRKKYENLEHEYSSQKCRIQELEASQSQTPKSSGLTTVFGMFGGTKDQNTATEPPKAEQFVSGVPESELRGKYNDLLKAYKELDKLVKEEEAAIADMKGLGLDVLSPTTVDTETSGQASTDDSEHEELNKLRRRHKALAKIYIEQGRELQLLQSEAMGSAASGGKKKSFLGAMGGVFEKGRDYDGEIKQLTTTLDNLNNEHTDLKKNFDSYRTDRESTESSLRRQLTDSQEDLARVTEKLKEVETENENLRQTVDRLKAEPSVAAGKVDAADQLLLANNNELEKMKNQNASLQTDLMKLEATNADLQKDRDKTVAALKAQVATANSFVEASRAALTKQTGENAVLKAIFSRQGSIDIQDGVVAPVETRRVESQGEHKTKPKPMPKTREDAPYPSIKAHPELHVRDGPPATCPKPKPTVPVTTASPEPPTPTRSKPKPMLSAAKSVPDTSDSATTLARPKPTSPPATSAGQPAAAAAPKPKPSPSHKPRPGPPPLAAQPRDSQDTNNASLVEATSVKPKEDRDRSDSTSSVSSASAVLSYFGAAIGLQGEADKSEEELANVKLRPDSVSSIPSKRSVAPGESKPKPSPKKPAAAAPPKLKPTPTDRKESQIPSDLVSTAGDSVASSELITAPPTQANMEQSNDRERSDSTSSVASTAALWSYFGSAIGLEATPSEVEAPDTARSKDKQHTSSVEQQIPVGREPSKRVSIDGEGENEEERRSSWTNMWGFGLA
eukprot:GHVQ01023304.1.p1 GENE.GHVQ01023304.1~~GHVQ01023304.1.p1  ORF type:complete len:1797 (+),score=354.80 GHVQ01023304.1:274-5664(+)